MSVPKMVDTLKENDQDYEWYPTTSLMIEMIKQRIPSDAESLLDIGAGDGRALEQLAEKCKNATLYSIELSPILMSAQPKTVIPIGTDLFEQNLSCLPVDYIFCNPRYSQFDEWVCKIIDEGYARKAFLVIPQRWKESSLIQHALKMRGATTTVIHSDTFEHAERRARAVIDIVEVTFPSDDRYYKSPAKDPFDIWFDQNIDTFDKAETILNEESQRDVARRYVNASIDEMVVAYLEEYRRLEGNYRAIFKLDQQILRELGVDKDHVREGLKTKMANLKIKYWHVLFERLDAITSRLSTKSKERLLKKLTKNTKVEFTASNCYAVVLWAVKNANQYFDDQLIDLFRALSTFDGVTNYKSNVKTWERNGWRHRADEYSHYALDYRIVVEQYSAIKTDQWNTWEFPGNLSRTCHNLIADVIAVMSNLGFQTWSSGSLSREWEGGRWENFFWGGEILFQVKAYKNGNLHFRFMPSAIRALNVEAGRLLKWLQTEQDVVTELGYTRQEAKRYFRSNSHLLPSHVKLLSNGESG